MSNTPDLTNGETWDRETFDTRIKAAKLWVAVRRWYMAKAVYRLTIIPSTMLPTMAVDTSWRVYANPHYVLGCTTERLAASLMHEANHVLRDHANRAKMVVMPGDNMRWNVAADIPINDMLADDNLDVDRENWMYSDKFDLDKGQTSEWYYRKLRDDANDNDNDDGDGGGSGGAGQPGEGEQGGQPGDPHGDHTSCGSGAGGDPVDGELAPDDKRVGSVSPTEGEIIRRQVANDIKEHEAKNGRGSVPGYLSEWASDLLRPKVDWRKALGWQLRNAVANRAGETTLTYRRRARRNPTDFILPGRVDPQVNIAVVWDTSGSVGDTDLTTIATELEGLLRTVNVADDQITVLTTSVQVTGVQKVSSMRQAFTMDRGGTDMRVGIDAALELKPRPDVVLIMTDGETPWPDEPTPGTTLIAGILCPKGDLDALRSHWAPPEFIVKVGIPTETDH
jgi:predicted metal-dependent peptidase